jgi:hypothetical protein
VAQKSTKVTKFFLLVLFVAFYDAMFPGRPHYQAFRRTKMVAVRKHLASHAPFLAWNAVELAWNAPDQAS